MSKTTQARRLVARQRRVVPNTTSSLDIRHYEHTALIPASELEVFEYVDDHSNLVAHMSRPSWCMGGGHMSLELDGQQGRAVGSRFRLIVVTPWSREDQWSAVTVHLLRTP